MMIKHPWNPLSFPFPFSLGNPAAAAAAASGNLPSPAPSPIPDKAGLVFWRACSSGNVDLVEEFLGSPRPFDVNWTDPELHRSGLYRAASHNHVAVVARLLRDPKIDVNLRTADHATALFIASQSGYVEVLTLLLLHPAIDVNLGNLTGATPLWQACWVGHTSVIRLLLDHPLVRQNAVNREGSTPLWIASQQGHLEAVKLLLASSRSLDVQARWERNKKTACEQALQNGHHEIARLLERYQADPVETRDQLRHEMRTLGKQALLVDIQGEGWIHSSPPPPPLSLQSPRRRIFWRLSCSCATICIGSG